VGIARERKRLAAAGRNRIAAGPPSPPHRTSRMLRRPLAWVASEVVGAGRRRSPGVSCPRIPSPVHRQASGACVSPCPSSRRSARRPPGRRCPAPAAAARVAAAAPSGRTSSIGAWGVLPHNESVPAPRVGLGSEAPMPFQPTISTVTRCHVRDAEAVAYLTLPSDARLCGLRSHWNGIPWRRHLDDATYPCTNIGMTTCT
jgi:hypothetical protein